VDEAKPFDISKREVWEAFRKVKANQGAAGVDRQSIADFEAKLSSNLYKLWNRGASNFPLVHGVWRAFSDFPNGLLCTLLSSVCRGC
jgi:retron-type reverse transcriptase